MFEFIRKDPKVSFFLLSLILLGAAWYVTGKKPEEIAQKNTSLYRATEKRIIKKDASGDVLEKIFSQALETKYFTLSAPSGWWIESETLEKNTATGVFTNGNMRLEYTYEIQENPFLINGDSAHTAVDDTVHSYPARIIYPSSENGYLTYIFFKNIEKENSLLLKGEYLTKDERKIAFEIFKSIQIK